MNVQQIENEEFERNYSPADRFAGFDRGDLDWDYDAEQQAKNEEFEAEMRAEGLL